MDTTDFNAKGEKSHFLTLHATHERGTRLRVKRCPFALGPGLFGGSIFGSGDCRLKPDPDVKSLILLTCWRQRRGGHSTPADLC